MSDWPDIFQRKRLELVLFEKIIQILFQHFKHQTSVVLVSETLVCANKIVFICIFLAENRRVMKIQNIISMNSKLFVNELLMLTDIDRHRSKYAEKLIKFTLTYVQIFLLLRKL